MTGDKKHGRPFDMELMTERHRLMLEYQEKIKPFTPSVRELEKLWYDCERGTLISTVRHVLNTMEKFGMVVTRRMGKSTKYYAIPKQ